MLKTPECPECGSDEIYHLSDAVVACPVVRWERDADGVRPAEFNPALQEIDWEQTVDDEEYRCVSGHKFATPRLDLSGVDIGTLIDECELNVGDLLEIMKALVGKATMEDAIRAYCKNECEWVKL